MNRGDRREAIFRNDADRERLRESATEKAERLAREGLRKLGSTEAELAKRPKGDGAKLELAVQLRRETPMTLKWIAERLRMGTGASLCNLWSERRRKGKESSVNLWD